MERKMTINRALAITTLALFVLLLAACGSDEASEATPAAAEVEEIPTSAPPEEESADEMDAGAGDAAAADAAAADAAEESGGPVVITNNDGPPFYARFGENETFDDGEQVVIVFYRPPDCIPPDFNLNRFFHFPGEDSPGAFACAPPTVSAIETWETAPGEDPAPLVAESTGLGDVPVWFFSNSDMETAMADGEVTITELAALPSRQVGTAATYDELLHPSQSNENPLVQFTAEGALEDGRAFSVDVSKGATDVADHVTIDIDE